jgi:hypothetical protein
MALNCLGFILGFIFVLLSVFAQPCYANHTFLWSFTDSSQRISSSLTECANLQINILPLAVVNTTTYSYGTPGYYLMAFEPNGFSTTTFAGMNHSNLTWQVNHAAGTQLMLSMADSIGNAGGVGSELHNELYTVVPGQDSSCLPPKPTTSLAIKANVTKNLATCDYWGLRVSGGTPPYTISLAAVGSPVVTNVTLDLGLDVMTYIDRADPNGLLLAAVSDSTGQFGNTSLIVNTVGSSNYSCPGLGTTYGKSSEIPFYYNSGSKSKRTTIIIAVCATIGGLLAIIGVILFGLWMRRKIMAARWIKDGQDTFPRVFKNPDTIDSPDSFATYERKQPLPASLTTTPTTMGTSKTSQSVFYPGVPPPGIVTHPSLHHAQSSNFSSDPNSEDRGSFITGSRNHLPLPDLPLPPITFNTDRYAKTQAPATRSTDDDKILRTPSSNPSIPDQPPTAGVQSLESDTEPDIIIQHRNGGVVQELPPPYLDRSQKKLPPDDGADAGGSGLGS